MKRKSTQGIVIHRSEIWKPTDYHYIVMRDGDYRLLVAPADVAFHALSYNKSTVSIAVFGDFASKEPGLNWHPTLAQLQTVKFLIAQFIRWFPSIEWISGHSELGYKGTAFPTKLVEGHTCPGEHFPMEEIIASSGLKRLPQQPVSSNLIA